MKQKRVSNFLNILCCILENIAAIDENISWKDKVKDSELYVYALCLEKLKVTSTIQNGIIALSGHVFRDESSLERSSSLNRYLHMG